MNIQQLDEVREKAQFLLRAYHYMTNKEAVEKATNLVITRYKLSATGGLNIKRPL